MDSIISVMNTTLSLSEKERDVHTLSETDLQDSNAPPKFFLVARCLSFINPQTFIKKMGEFWSNKCRFDVVVSEMHSDLFLLTMACAGDKYRVISGEPWHFFNHLILLHSPASLQSVKKEDLFKAHFWVQTHRLPFLSKSRALARKVGEWVGEFVEVYEDSLHEGWGSFLRTRVLIDITQLLMQGKMVTLPKVQDEHWLEFRYENLPTFCFHCGILGHPFDKCKAFLELVDNGEDPDLPYGPQMIGDKLPKAGYDRYRNDFSKANAYPFLTRLAKKTIASTLLALYTNPNIAIGAIPQPKPLTLAESNMPDQSNVPNNNQSPEMPLPFPSYIPTAFHSASSSTNPIPTPVLTTPVHLPLKNSLNAESIAHYPSHPILPKPSDSSPVLVNKGKAIMTSDESIELGDYGKSFKRQIDPENLRSVLKRCRGNKRDNIDTEEIIIQHVSRSSQDSAENNPAISAERPNLLFIMETKLKCNSLDRIRHSLKFNNGLEVPRVGLKGGLLLLWMTNVDVTLNSYSMNHFDAFVLYENGCRFHFTTFYGAPESHLRTNTWNLLRSFATPSNNFPWLVLGDFNELLSNEDKDGGPLRSEKLMNDFKQAIDFYNLITIPYTGDRYTWTNKHYNGTLVKERLDRGFHNGVWTDFFVDSPLSHLDLYHSDHRAIAYNVSLPQQMSISTTRHHRFRFEQFWLKDSDCRDCSTALQNWHVSKYGQMGRDIAAAHKHSSQLHNSNDRSLQHFQTVEDADKILDDLLEKEELYWHQRARVNWLQSGDSNTKFFHARAKSRNATNRIKSLNTDVGGVIHGDEDIANEVTSYFSKLFTSNGVDIEALNMVLSTIQSAITPEMNAILLQPFTASDVENALHSMAPDKSPGVDVSKAIAVRFKEALPFVISQHQSAFLPNRLITNNVLLAFELVHCLKNKKRGRLGYSTLKLDMSKAFDRVEWFFLRQVMTKMGFDINWVNLVMKCVTTATLSFNINGAIKGSVVPQRGLRQGDPLSPYLFLICSEGLSSLLKNEESLGQLKGLSIARLAPAVSHLLFADDSLLFYHATEESCQAIRRVLDLYHRASGQLLNTEKTVMSFSPNTSQATKDRFNHVLGMPICDLHEKYLGLPSYAGRDKKELFSGIKDGIWKLMNTWHAKLFSIGGREILLKAVVQSIPTYAMSCFSLPKKFCNQLESMMANFWWGSNANHSKIHWKKWKFLCSSKVDGGMGFRSFIHFNQALLAKPAWRIFNDPSSLLARVLQARYFKDGNFLSAKKGVLPSLTWQSICDGKELLLKGLRWKIGNGQSVRCVKDPWLPGNTTFTPYYYGGDPLFTVAHYITNERQWDLRILEDHFGTIDIERILSIPLAPSPREDMLVWHHSDTSYYTVKSGYHLAASLETMEAESHSSSNRQWWNLLWALRLPKKVKIFAWRFINDALPTAANLMHRKISTSSACSLYLCAWESVGHAIFCCTRAKAVWKISKCQVQMPNIGNLKGFDIFSHLANVNKDADLERIICIMWCIWTERNKEIHGSKPKFAEPPGKDMYKLNIDAAIDSKGAIIGVGALIRTDAGDVVAGLSKVCKGCCSPKEMEALAMFYGLQWALMHNFPLNFIEIDSLLLSNALHCLSSTKCITPFYDLVEDINYLMSFFPRVKVSHVKRDANQAAHGLAKFALRLDKDMVWLGEIPSPIVFVVVADSSH
uniref:Reverse transcriptase domain-containing protein n=1 Tax=Cannabis sativa TaxID=3483 RepID=A0A803PZ04_CANSA